MMQDGNHLAWSSTTIPTYKSISSVALGGWHQDETQKGQQYSKYNKDCNKCS